MLCDLCFCDRAAAVCYPCDPAAVEPRPEWAVDGREECGSVVWPWLVDVYGSPNWDALSGDHEEAALAVKRGWCEQGFDAAARDLMDADRNDAERKAQAERDKQAFLVGAHLGVVGERFDFPPLLCVAVVDLGEAVYSGRTVERLLIKFIDPEGNAVVWFTTKGGKFEPEADKKYQMAAFVKSHEDYQGARQTIINRPKGEAL